MHQISDRQFAEPCIKILPHTFDALAGRIVGGMVRHMMQSGKFSTVLELAQYLKSDRSHVARILSLVNLALDIVTAVMTGKAPKA